MNKIVTNQSPDLAAAHIAKTLFNDPFLSDVQFLFGDCVLYAHSWMLMNRSTVFQNQLESTMDTKKLIPIVDTEYAIFYQFIRFVYTDECDVVAENKIELLKLAVRYKVITLEIKLVNMKSIDIEQHLSLFEYCVVNKYEMAFGYTSDLIKFYLNLVLKCDRFITLHPDALVEILKFNDVRDGIREIDFFNALVRWVNFACTHFEIPIDQHRTYFDKFTRLIRFSSMTADEVRACLKTNPDLVSNDEAALISIFGDGSEHRLRYVRPCETRRFLRHWRRKTKFTVLSDVVLNGLRYGIKFNESALELRITVRNLITNAVDMLDYRFAPSTEILILGDAFVLKPNFEYTIDVKYEEEEKEFKIFTRRRNENVIVNGPREIVQMTESSANLIEIFFKTI